MTITWTPGTNTVRISDSQVATTQDLVTAIADTSYAQNLHSVGNIDVFELRNVRVAIESGSAWAEIGAAGSDFVVWVYHEYSGDNSAVEFEGSDSRMEFGDEVVTTPSAPVSVRGHHYWFLTYNKSASFRWSEFGSTASPGKFYWHGGMFEQITTLLFDNGNNQISVGDTIKDAASGETASAYVTAIEVTSGTWGGGDAAGRMALAKVVGQWDDNDPIFVGSTDSADADGSSGTFELWLPSTEVKIVQANFARAGGVRFFGTANTVLESKFKQSRDKGLSFGGNNAGVFRKLQLHKFKIALTLTGSGIGTIRNLSVRGCDADLEVDTFDGKLALIDSTSIENINGTCDFDDTPDNSYVVEQNGASFHTITPAGADLSGVRVNGFRTSNWDHYGSGGATDANGEHTEILVKRTQYDQDHTTYAARLQFGSASFVFRSYGRKTVVLKKVLGEVPLVGDVVMVDDPFTVDGPGGQYDDTTAVGYTGVAIDKPNQELDITAARTMAELYSKVQSLLDDAANDDVPELLKTDDGVGYVIAEDSGWTITGAKTFLDLQGCYIVKEDGAQRFVEVEVRDVVSGAEVFVLLQSDNTVLGNATATGTSVKVVCDYPGTEQAVIIRAREAGYIFFETVTTLLETGISVTAALEEDEVFT